MTKTKLSKGKKIKVTKNVSFNSHMGKEVKDDGKVETVYFCEPFCNLGQFVLR